MSGFPEAAMKDLAQVTLKIIVEGRGTYYETVYMEDTEVHEPLYSYTGPYFVEVSIDHITYL
ncbi:MAG TPA: hypothetical protein VNI52_13820 [Sphingobacteriaceae bacterium]|nr:hypothetical protein [Sphingobacteriaceae bacterium]